MKGKDFKASVMETLKNISDDMEIVHYVEPENAFFPATGINLTEINLVHGLDTTEYYLETEETKEDSPPIKALQVFITIDY